MTFCKLFCEKTGWFRCWWNLFYTKAGVLFFNYKKQRSINAWIIANMKIHSKLWGYRCRTGSIEGKRKRPTKRIEQKVFDSEVVIRLIYQSCSWAEVEIAKYFIIQVFSIRAWLSTFGTYSTTPRSLAQIQGKLFSLWSHKSMIQSDDALLDRNACYLCQYDKCSISCTVW